MPKQKKKKCKCDKINHQKDESLASARHKMLVSAEDFQKTFQLIKEEYFALEKVDLIDYHKFFDS